jgi:hypothetical protein
MYMHICSNESHDITPDVQFSLDGLSTYVCIILYPLTPITQLSIPHGTTSDELTKRPSIYHHSPSDLLQLSEVIQDNVLI